jgi:hypothetical protein
MLRRLGRSSSLQVYTFASQQLLFNFQLQYVPLSPGDFIINTLRNVLSDIFFDTQIPTANMKFTTVVATILSMAVFAVAAPVATAGTFDRSMGSKSYYMIAD